MRSLVVAVFLLAGLLTAQVAHADALKVGDRLAELDVAVDGAGKSFKLKALKGGWVLVTVGADWCKPCAKELPAWDKLAPEFKSKVKFVAINIADNIDDGKKFNAKLKLKNLQLVYMPADKSAVVAKYGSDNMPTTFIADPQGVIRYVRAGFEKGDVSGETKKMREQLTKLTAAK
ncbi:MAG TPA: TlpA disulfide reductase family protein [Kofleriaceae bacterium]|nr:TlpA disulfide reductase family protein [Kofleriaceae bacterium]